MTLSATEKKMVEGLRKREAMLRRWRWPLAIIHGGVVVGALVLVIVLTQLPEDIPSAKPMVIAFMLPPLFLLMTGSSLWFVYVIANWHGNAKTHLLLRLIDESHANAA